MKNYVAEFKQGLRPLLQPKAIVVGVAILNFTVVYLRAEEVEEGPGFKFCFGAPWYLTAPWENFPLLLLLAAVTLYLRRWWAYMLAVAFSAPVMYQWVVDASRALMTDSWWAWMGYGLSLQFQYALGAALISMAVTSLARVVRR